MAPDSKVNREVLVLPTRLASATGGRPRKGLGDFARESKPDAGPNGAAAEAITAWKKAARAYSALGCEITSHAYALLEEGDGSVTGRQEPPKRKLSAVARDGIDKEAIVRLLTWVKESAACGDSETGRLEALVENVKQNCPPAVREGATSIEELKLAIDALREVEGIISELEKAEGAYAHLHTALEAYYELIEKIAEVNFAIRVLEEKTGKGALIEIEGRAKPVAPDAIMRLLISRMPRALQDGVRGWDEKEELQLPEMKAGEAFTCREDAISAIRDAKAAYSMLLAAAQKLAEEAGIGRVVESAVDGE